MIQRTRLCLWIAFLGALLATVMVYPTLNQPDKMGPREFTRSKLGRVEGYMLDFYDVNGTWPGTNSWEMQLRPHFNKDTWFSPEESILDRWGSKIKYEIRSSSNGSERILYSFGPNKVDNHGTNDDILIRVYDPSKRRR